ncbi:hypothetical protein CERZMDRAFT_88165 [Cercospora zeae-maydis SCOH1-5]|uniref:Uncharacterized protein n=1 Tax=Cercospora zeae-maydis SCOH1-5 TaxID=717836 RepID=A0A6A6F2G7_9PEZI|nr:hypothetical protein CERZMDRAFT_88165 [Cercospora zeae-maydis SCOH1-5]
MVDSGGLSSRADALEREQRQVHFCEGHWPLSLARRRAGQHNAERRVADGGSVAWRGSSQHARWVWRAGRAGRVETGRRTRRRRYCTVLYLRQVLGRDVAGTLRARRERVGALSGSTGEWRRREGRWVVRRSGSAVHRGFVWLERVPPAWCGGGHHHQCRAKVRRYCSAQARSSLAVSALQRGSSRVVEQSKGYSKKGSRSRLLVHIHAAAGEGAGVWLTIGLVATGAHHALAGSPHAGAGAGAGEDGSAPRGAWRGVAWRAARSAAPHGMAEGGGHTGGRQKHVASHRESRRLARWPDNVSRAVRRRCLPACLLACLPACLSACLPATEPSPRPRDGKVRELARWLGEGTALKTLQLQLLVRRWRWRCCCCWRLAGGRAAGAYCCCCCWRCCCCCVPPLIVAGAEALGWHSTRGARREIRTGPILPLDERGEYWAEGSMSRRLSR